jgi:hypothetical protein
MTAGSTEADEHRHDLVKVATLQPDVGGVNSVGTLLRLMKNSVYVIEKAATDLVKYSAGRSLPDVVTPNASP